MSKYVFDTIIDRMGTDSLKHDHKQEMGYPQDVLPLWVADMDFKTAPQIIKALKDRVQHGIFGYTEPKKDYFETVVSWYRRNFDYSPDSDSIVLSPGVVFALSAAVNTFTEKGDAVIIQPPVYYPFHNVVKNNGRKLVLNELICTDGKYSIDFEDLEKKTADNNVKLFILCSPHNPVGRVWTQSELERIGEICHRYGVIVVSDEIHSDFVHSGFEHTVFTNAYPQLRENSIICTSPSKSFNLAGLQVSHIFIENEKMRSKFKKHIFTHGYGECNTLGLTAARAAYESGAEWLNECRSYIEENLCFVREFLSNHLPQLKLIEPQGTYFAWIDFSALGLGKKELDDLIINKAHLWLDAGHIFGNAGEGYQRVVLACPRSVLVKAFEQLEAAVKELG
ncbi:MAG: pyridoxal phosphate-dependent aminotransferase [Ruminococcus sp.]|nr:pyridoxal phosphate-dependent aminotransferase [Ruminococcus sp.]